MNAPLNGYVMETSGLKLVQPPGLRSPRQRISYDSQEVQENLIHAFDGLIPYMNVIDGDYVQYHWDDGSGRDSCAESVPVESMAALPKGEMLRLMQGWIMLRKLAQNPNLPAGMDTMMLNFRIPDPRIAPKCYRVYKCPKTRQQKIHICWGYESSKMPSIPIDRAVAAFFGVTVENITSLLATSMVNHATTESIPLPSQTTLHASQYINDSNEGKRHNKWIWLSVGMAAAITLLSCIVMAGRMNEKNNEANAVVKHALPVATSPRTLPVSMRTPQKAEESSKPLYNAVNSSPMVSVPAPSLDAAVMVTKESAQTQAIGVESMLTRQKISVRKIASDFVVKPSVDGVLLPTAP